MAWDRLELKQSLKDELGLARNREDGLLPDALIHKAVNDAMKRVADDCHLLPVHRKLALIQGQWEYPIDSDVQSIRRIWFVEDDNTRYELVYREPEAFMDGLDPTDTSSQPVYFCYPVFQRPVYEFFAAAPDVYDYVGQSHCTTGSIRTVIDSGINFGRTLDGKRVRPKCIVHNNTDDSYGYVEQLDITTSKASGTADAGTTTDKLVDAAVNFVATSVAVDDIICSPSVGVVTKYAFVTAIDSATQLAYADMEPRSQSFAAGETYKVGQAQEIRLSMATPHPGLRSGADNTFAVGAVKATLVGTTFTATRCTGAPTTGAEGDDIAIAAGGSHAKISAVTATYIDVDRWIGGIPVDGEVVTVRLCDEYQVEDRYRTQKVLWITPAIDTSDAIGSESLSILFNGVPNLPEEDDDPIEIPENYARPLQRCLRWYAEMARASMSEREIAALEGLYIQTAREFLGDIWQTPRSRQVSAVRNRRRVSRWGVKDQTLSGAKYQLNI
jgi:hypothetical protein